MKAAAGATLTFLLRFRRQDIPVCQTRIIRGPRGLPWEKQIAVHPLPNGSIEMIAVDVEPEDDP